MTEQPPSAIGTVAQEAARLIEDIATMARSGHSPGNDPRPYAGEPEEPAFPDAPDASQAAGVGGDHQAGEPEAGERGPADGPSTGACSMCGAVADAVPESCRVCPLCRGIALLRSVRPETVDLLADLALSLAASLRDVATRSRASDPASPHGSASGGSPDGDRAPVQDIQVDDESEG